MTNWTKPESYNAKTIAWHKAKERIRERPITAIWIDESDMVPPTFQLGDMRFVVDPKGVQPPRIRAEFGGRRSGKAARIMGIDLASGPDKSVRAEWVNGRLWILGDDE